MPLNETRGKLGSTTSVWVIHWTLDACLLVFLESGLSFLPWLWSDGFLALSWASFCLDCGRVVGDSCA